MEIEIVKAGRTTGKYQPMGNGFLRLEQISRSEVELPFDIGILPSTLAESEQPTNKVSTSSLTIISAAVFSEELGESEKNRVRMMSFTSISFILFKNHLRLMLIFLFNLFSQRE